MGKILIEDRPVHAAPRSFAASGGVVAAQVGSDLRESADAMRTALNVALCRLHESEGETSLTALVERIAGRFRNIHRDIGDLASSLESPPVGQAAEPDRANRR